MTMDQHVKTYKTAAARMAIGVVSEFADAAHPDAAHLSQLMPMLAGEMFRARNEIDTPILRGHAAEGRHHVSNLIRQYRAAQALPVAKLTYDNVLAEIKQASPLEKILTDPKVNAALISGSGIGSYTLMKEACEHGRLDLIRHLLESEIAYNPLYRGLFGLELAATHGHLDIVRYFIERGVDVKQTSAKYAVEAAAKNGHLEIVRYLHESGVDIRGGFDLTLHQTAANGHIEVVHYLYESGIYSRTEDIPLCAAARNGQVDMMRYLDKHTACDVKEKVHALCDAAGSGRMDAALYLQKQGIDIKVWGDMALYDAAKGGQLEMVKWLHEQGADIRTTYGSPVCGAAEGGHLEVLRWLAEHGADIDGLYKSHAPDLIVKGIAAGRKGCLDVFKFIYERKAAAGDTGPWAHLLVSCALREGCVDAAKFLHEKDSNLIARQPAATLRHVVNCNHFVLQHFLLERGIPHMEGNDQQMQEIERWQKTARCPPPKGLEPLSPEGFNSALFKNVRTMFDREGYDRDDPGSHCAYHLCRLFGKEETILRYLRR